LALTPELRQRFAQIRLLSLDVDGVLTDGGVWYTEYGDELRRFDTRDGDGLMTLRDCGIEVVFVSLSPARAMVHRGRKLRIHTTQNGLENKLDTVESIAQGMDLRLTQVAHCGDDLDDLPLLQSVGLPLAVADAVAQVRAAAAYVTERPGGRGAVREICDLLLAARET